MENEWSYNDALNLNNVPNLFTFNIRLQINAIIIY